MYVQVRVNDDKLEFLLELLDEFDFMEVTSVSKKASVTVSKKKKLTAYQLKEAAEIREALEQVELHLQGKIKLKTLKEVLDEL